MIDVFEMSFFTNYPKKLELLTGLTADKVKVDFLKNNYVLPQQFKFERPGLEEAIVYFPRISPDFKQCVYLYAKEPRHSSNHTFGLRHFWLADPNSTTSLTEPVLADTGDFCGLNGFSFILNSWSWLGNDRVVCSTWTHQTTKIYEVVIADKSVHGISRPTYLQSESHHVVGALDANTLLVRRDTIYRNNLFFLLQRDASGEYSEHLLHHPLDEGYTIEEEEVVVDGIEGTFYGIKDETIAKETRPCILFVHGGPHVVWNNTFHHLFRFLMDKHFTVLNVNYSGSAGRGEEFSERIFKQIHNVSHEMVKLCEKLAADKKIDIKQIKYFSGSTGGTIGQWFLHNHPNFLESMSIYNPPFDGNTLQYESVFPGLGPGTFFGDNTMLFGPKHPFDEQNTLKLQKNSVLNHSFTFTTKVLLFAGLKDSVVHRTSNRRLYKTAREHGLKMELFEYPEEEHVIITPNASFDFFFKTSLLFLGKWKFS
jgi:dipeptidyl aminopeptidase/acylaminoacyl peptidase